MKTTTIFAVLGLVGLTGCESTTISHTRKPLIQKRFIVEQVQNQHFLNSKWGTGRGLWLGANPHQRVQFKYSGCESFGATNPGEPGYQADITSPGRISILTYPTSSQAPSQCDLTITQVMLQPTEDK